MWTRRSFALFLAAAVVLCSTATPSAQLLPRLLAPIKPVTAGVNGLLCSISSPSSAAKLDNASRRWVDSGGQGQVRVIASAAPGVLTSVKNLVLTVSGRLLGDLPGINGEIIETDLDGLSSLACSSTVSSLSLDAPVAATGDAAAGSAYTLRAALGLPADTPAGAGIGVSVIDSGIAGSADFGSRIVAAYDFMNGAKAVTSADGYGHGTHVAGLIGGSGSLLAGAPYQGVGPQVRLISMKVLDAGGAGRTSDVIRAVEYATSRRAALGIQIINLSLGHPIYEAASRDPLVRAVEAASRAGIVVVVAAGNYGTGRSTGEIAYSGITSPGNAPSAITVGAFNTRDTAARGDDEVAPYSSRGPSWYDGFAKPDIVAPGHNLVSDAAAGSTLYSQYPSLRVSPSYLRLSGTSMAAAVTSGAVALVLDTTWVDPWVGGVGSFISHAGSYAVLIAAAAAAGALFLGKRAPWPALLLLLGFGWQIFTSHASPHGPIGFGLLIAAALWIWLAERRPAGAPVALEA